MKGISFFVPSVAVGIDYIMACILKFPHILLVDQATGHRKMDPDNLDWNNFNAKEYIFIGTFFTVIGLVGIIFFIFI